jgi:hypothetical protein
MAFATETEMLLLDLGDISNDVAAVADVLGRLEKDDEKDFRCNGEFSMMSMLKAQQTIKSMKRAHENEIEKYKSRYNNLLRKHAHEKTVSRSQRNMQQMRETLADCRARKQTKKN